MTYQHGNSQYHITVSRGGEAYQVRLDGVMLPDDRIPLMKDGQSHTVEIVQN
jgi:cellobiose phosphorylase